jgi:hypothetical protein
MRCHQECRLIFSEHYLSDKSTHSRKHGLKKIEEKSPLYKTWVWKYAESKEFTVKVSRRCCLIFSEHYLKDISLLLKPGL